MIVVRQPTTKEELEEYYDLRYRVLREPWGQPRGSEKDEFEDQSIHVMAVDDSTGKVVAVGKLRKRSDEEGQISHMAVAPEYQRRGIGLMITEELTAQARKLGLKRLVVTARNNVIGFYEKAGYRITGEAYKLFGYIPLSWMELDLQEEIETSRH